MARTVLVIDDLSFYRRRLRNLLRELGYQVHEAADASIGLATAERVQPDAVLLDEVMPGTDTLETLSALAVEGRTVLVLSPKPDAASAAPLLDAGAHAVLAKTARREEFQAHLAAAFDPAAAA